MEDILDSKVHVTNMGPTWVLSAPGGPHVGPMNFAIRDSYPVPYHVIKSLQLCNLKIRHPLRWTRGARSSNELHWLDLNIGHRDKSLSDVH